MFESDWHCCNNVTAMLSFLRHNGVATDRKLRLFAIACCRHLLRRVLVDPNYSHAVDVAERFADGEATAFELMAPFPGCQNTPKAQRTASIACQNLTETENSILMADCVAGNAAWAVGEHAATMASVGTDSAIFNAALNEEIFTQAAMLRDIFGPIPFRSISLGIDYSLAPNIRGMTNQAKSIYEKREFTPNRMNALADKLRDAGCEDNEMILHCRNTEQIHVRGCWVIDLILSKDR